MSGELPSTRRAIISAAVLASAILSDCLTSWTERKYRQHAMATMRRIDVVLGLGINVTSSETYQACLIL